MSAYSKSDCVVSYYMACYHVFDQFNLSLRFLPTLPFVPSLHFVSSLHFAPNLPLYPICSLNLFFVLTVYLFTKGKRDSKEHFVRYKACQPHPAHKFVKVNNGHPSKKPPRTKYKWIVALEKKKVKRILNINKTNTTNTNT